LFFVKNFQMYLVHAVLVFRGYALLAFSTVRDSVKSDCCS